MTFKTRRPLSLLCHLGSFKYVTMFVICCPLATLPAVTNVFRAHFRVHSQMGSGGELSRGTDVPKKRPDCVLYSCLWVTGGEIPNGKERTPMPKPALHALIWCEDSQQYELQSRGKTEQWFRQGDEPAFACWLVEQSAFSFAGRAGRLSVRKEGRGNGKGYWYAYRKQNRRIR